MESKDKDKEPEVIIDWASLDTQAATGCWLFKVPRVVADEWEKQLEGAPLGNLYIHPAAVGESKVRVTANLNLGPELPSEWALHFEAPQQLQILSEDIAGLSLSPTLCLSGSLCRFNVMTYSQAMLVWREKFNTTWNWKLPIQKSGQSSGTYSLQSFCLFLRLNSSETKANTTQEGTTTTCIRRRTRESHYENPIHQRRQRQASWSCHLLFRITNSTRTSSEKEGGEERKNGQECDILFDASIDLTDQLMEKILACFREKENWNLIEINKKLDQPVVCPASRRSSNIIRRICERSFLYYAISTSPDKTSRHINSRGSSSSLPEKLQLQLTTILPQCLWKTSDGSKTNTIWKTSVITSYYLQCVSRRLR